MFGGVVNKVLIGTLVYLSDGIDTLSVGITCCFILVSNRPKTIKHCIQMYLPVYKNAHFFSEVKSACILYARQNTFSSYEVICITRQNYEVEQLPTPSL